jgi:CspA family cold shock protein
MSHQGTCKKWTGGFGFIRTDDTNESIFVHQSNLQMEGYRELQPGQKVEFDIEQTPRGPTAVRVRLIGEAPPSPAASPKQDPQPNFHDDGQPRRRPHEARRRTERDDY